MEKLTEREKEVLKLITLGYRNSIIAEKLFITKETVKAHMSSILKKPEVKNRIQAAVKAIEEGLV